jgi:hypothetical protein
MAGDRTDDWMVRPPAVDRSCELGQPVAPAKLLDELSARAAADEGGDVGAPEALDGRSRVRERSDVSHDAFLGGFETDGDLVEAEPAQPGGDGERFELENEDVGVWQRESCRSIRRADKARGDNSGRDFQIAPGSA